MRRHPRAKRLELIFQLAEKDEKQALKNWGEIQQKLDLETQQREQLIQYADEYRSRFSADHNDQLNAGYLHHCLDFISKIEKGLQAQQEQLHLLQAQAEQAKQVFLQAQAKRKGFEHMLDKLDKEYDQAQLKVEQKEADEWANRRAFQNNGSGL